ncbi:MAG: esterase [Bacteroidaceae bacterium]|nr:esterase [Bacteroidaceae bacterium]
MAVLALASTLTFAQEAIFGQRAQGSPHFNDDGTVTLRLKAPEAKKVVIVGDCVENLIAEMKNVDGEWTYTTPVLLPELYNYRFHVDGAEALDPANVERSRDVLTFMNTFIVSKAEGDQGYLYGNHQVPHGDVAQVWYDSPTLGMSRCMTIYTPAGYDKGKKFPVLYLLHGAGGDEDAWVTLGRTCQILDNLIALGKAEPMIVVMPNGNAWDDASPIRSGLAKKVFPPKATFEDSFVDIIKYVESHYKVKKGPRNTAICGLSMGGYHTFKVSNLHPGRFAYIGLFSAAISMDFNTKASVQEQIAADAAASKQVADVFAARPQLYWIAIGKDDFLMPQNVSYRAYLDSRQLPYEYYESEGGHSWRNWRVYLSMFAQRLFRE